MRRTMIIKPKRPETDFAPTSFVHSFPLRAATEPIPRDAEFEALQGRLLKTMDTGDWLPWFVEVSSVQQQVFDAYGCPKDVRAAVVEPLKKLYPPRTCLELLKDERNCGIVSGLFSASVLDAITLIRLGNRLVRVRRWPDKKLVSALRSVEGFAAHRLSWTYGRISNSVVSDLIASRAVQAGSVPTSPSSSTRGGISSR